MRSPAIVRAAGAVGCVRMWGPLGIALASLAAALALAPAVVNGDGLGYLNASVGHGLYPGHLLFLPIVRGLRALAHVGPRPVDGLWVARVWCATSGAAAVLFVGAAARRLGASAIVAAAGLAASFGALAAASDVETYAPSLAMVALALYFVARRRARAENLPAENAAKNFSVASAAGNSSGANAAENLGGAWELVGAAMALALAALLHVENVLLAPALALALPRRDRAPLVLAAGALVAAAYGLAIHHYGARWLLGAGHGFHYPLTVAAPAVALYGACKALVFSPYPYEASWPSVLTHFTLGLGALVAVFSFSRRAPLGRAATATWALAYSLVGILFFASDYERWIFLLPLLWLSAATTPRRRAALATAALIAIANVAIWWPRARDASWRERATAAAAFTRDGDLVVSPGHGWDEYVGFYDGPKLEHFPLAYYAGALGEKSTLAAALARAAAETRARGGRVLLLRFTDERDPMGWKELAAFGITPANAAALLPAGRRVALSDSPSLSIERLDP